MGLQTSSNELLELTRLVDVKPQVRVSPKGKVYKVKGHKRRVKGKIEIDDVLSVAQAEEWLKDRWPKSDLRGMTREDVPALRLVLRAIDDVVKEYPHILNEPDPKNERIDLEGYRQRDRQFQGVMTHASPEAYEDAAEILSMEGRAWGVTGGPAENHDTFVYLSTGESFREGMRIAHSLGMMVARDPYEAMTHEMAHVVDQTSELTEQDIEMAARDAYGTLKGAVETLNSQYSVASAAEMFAESFLAKRSTNWSRLYSDHAKKRIQRFLSLLEPRFV